MMYNENPNESSESIQDRYINERLDSQIEYYSRKARVARSLDRWSKVLSLIFAALIPVVVTIESLELYSKAAVVVLSMLTIISIAVQQIFQPDRVWKEYLDASVKLRHEKNLFLSNIEYYNSFPELVENVENIVSSATNTKVTRKGTYVYPAATPANYWQDIEERSNK